MQLNLNFDFFFFLSGGIQISVVCWNCTGFVCHKLDQNILNSVFSGTSPPWFFQ